MNFGAYNINKNTEHQRSQCGACDTPNSMGKSEEDFLTVRTTEKLNESKFKTN
jgi:hypothetical protein